MLASWGLARGYAHPLGLSEDVELVAQNCLNNKLNIFTFNYITLGGMNTSRIALRNIAAVTLLTALLFLSQAIAPPRTLKEANLSCKASGISMIFDSMQACTSSKDYRAGCACGPLRNPWSTAYHWGLAPFLTALVGLIALRGKLTTQLLLLNATIVFVLLIQVIIGIQKHDSAVMAIPLIPIIAAVECGIISGWFFFLRYCHQKLRGSTYAT